MNQSNISRGSALAAAVAWLLCGTTAARAVARPRGRRPAPGGVDPLRLGRAAPRPVVVVPPATVRYDTTTPVRRWWSRRPSGCLPQSVRGSIFPRFRPGYRPIVVGTTQYYVYPALPPVYQTVVVNGVTYYLADGVYYQPYLYQGQTVYMVAPPPIASPVP